MRLPILLLAAFVVQEPARVPVAWSLKKGEKVRYEVSHRVVSGAERSIDLTMWIALDAGDRKDDGSTQVRIGFERVALVKTGHDREDYDSARDKEPPPASYPRVLSKLVNRSLMVGMKPDGRCEGLDATRGLLQEAVDAWPDLKGRPSWDATSIDAKARSLAWIFRTVLETPKGGPAAVGDSWETKYDGTELGLPGGVATCRAQLKSAGQGEATIDQSVTFEFGKGMDRAIKEAGGKGALAWDTGRGLLKTLGASSKFVTIRGETTHTLTVSLQK